MLDELGCGAVWVCEGGRECGVDCLVCCLSLSVPDYASVNTYRDLVENKENIDWCSENYRTVHDRIRCMRTLTPGPLLA